jgi:hypothetical protein
VANIRVYGPSIVHYWYIKIDAPYIIFFTKKIYWVYTRIYIHRIYSRACVIYAQGVSTLWKEDSI